MPVMKFMEELKEAIEQAEEKQKRKPVWSVGVGLREQTEQDT